MRPHAASIEILIGANALISPVDCDVIGRPGYCRERELLEGLGLVGRDGCQVVDRGPRKLKFGN